MEFAFATVIYPEVKKFLPEFIKSLQSQTDHQFHLLIVNDGCDIWDIDMGSLNHSYLPAGGSISRNREILVNEAKKRNYEWIIFGDSDDYFDYNRIEKIRLYSEKYDLIANEIIPFDGECQYEPKFQKALGYFKEISTVFIRDKNLFGFSNVACRLDYLKNSVIPSEIIAVDWYLFAKAIQAGARACFTSGTNTYYRQWEGNITGITKENIKLVKTGVKAKYFHYKNMLNSDPWYVGELIWLKNLYYKSDTQDFNSYYKKLEQQKGNFSFWWENIKNY